MRGQEQPGGGSLGDDAVDAASKGSDGANALRATVGGMQAVANLQTAYYAGQVPREAAIANAKIMFGFSDAEANSLFPEVAPTKMVASDVPQTGPGSVRG